MHHTGLAADPAVQKHDTGDGHPECAARYASIMDRLATTDLLTELLRIESRSATNDDLALIHAPDYIQLVAREIEQGRTELSTGDAVIGAHSLEAARVAAGAGLSAVDAVFSGIVVNAFCLVRPPGHHATANRGMGFCLFNNIAIAARYAQRKYGAEHVLIVDWDVHHGNGTQDIFYRDGSVLFFSTHQWPLYPGTGPASETGEGDGAGKTINCPLPAGSGREEILSAFQSKLVPAAQAFQPDLILISAGFDSRIGDPLGGFTLSDEDFRELTCVVTEMADQYCDGRIVSLLEGGYNLRGLALATEAHIRSLQTGT